MPNTKNYSTRLRVLDQCLRSGHAYSGKELTEFINRELELRGEPTITSRTTLMDDLLNIENEYHTNIVRKKHGRQTTYQYEAPNFSIFSTELSEDDLLHLSQALDILKRFDFMLISSLCYMCSISVLPSEILLDTKCNYSAPPSMMRVPTALIFHKLDFRLIPNQC